MPTFMFVEQGYTSNPLTGFHVFASKELAFASKEPAWA